MPVSVGGSKGKTRFITEGESQKILKACPDLQWRLIFSLCRYGGVRCPSEVLALTWENVLWDSSRIVVTAPKTKRYAGHETRVIPMFPELAGVLNEAYEMAFDRLEDKSAVVSGPVVTRYTSADQNLRTTFEKIVKRAGLIPWPNPFQNLRATRETELMETYPSHVVVSWIGHSETVAQKHYLQTTDAHFEKAVIADASEPVAHQVAHKTREVGKTEEQAEKKNPAKLNVLRGSADGFASLRDQKITRPGLEPVPGNTGETALSEIGGHPGGQFGNDSDSVASLRQQALTSLQLAWRDIRRMESLSDDPAESKVAGRALAFVDRAFEELEGSKR